MGFLMNNKKLVLSFLSLIFVFSLHANPFMFWLKKSAPYVGAVLIGYIISRTIDSGSDPEIDFLWGIDQMMRRHR